MGKISQALKSRLTLAREDMKRKREFNQRIQQRERDEYNRAYEAGRIKRARQEGYAAGHKSKGGIVGTVLRYGESFSKAGEEMFGLDSLAPKKRGKKKKEFELW